MSNDHRQRAEIAAHEYWARVHSGEPRQGLVAKVAWVHGVTDQELKAAIGKDTPRATAS